MSNINPSYSPASSLSAFGQAVWAIVWKDLVIERHTRQTLSLMLVFSLAIAVVFNFALGSQALSSDLSAARNAAVGFLWSTTLLAGTLGLNRTLMQEQENQAMSALLLAPIDRTAIYIGKVCSLTLFSLLVQAILLPVFIAFFDRPFWRPSVWGVLMLGIIGFVAAGILVGAMTVQTRNRGVLLPVLLLPLSLPAILAAATVTTALMETTLPAWDDISFPLSLVVAYDVLVLVAGVFTFPYVVEE